MRTLFAVDRRDQGVTIGRTLQSRQQEAEGALRIGTEEDASGRSVDEPDRERPSPSDCRPTTDNPPPSFSQQNKLSDISGLLPAPSSSDGAGGNR